MQTTLVQPTLDYRHSTRALTSNGHRPTISRALETNGLCHRLGDLSEPAAKGGRKEDRNLFEALINSKLFQDYERAFAEATGLPVTLRPVETWRLPLHGQRKESRFCALMAEKSRTCAACLQVQESLAKAATQQPHTVTCPSGLCETAVPVRMGNRLIGFLQTGQVFLTKPTEERFRRAAELLAQWGMKDDQKALREAYFATPVVPARQHESVIKLLTIFAEHLAILSNQLLMKREHSEPPTITRAKAYIEEHQTEDISLDEVAKAVHMSTFYFCKVFKKATGINFTDYVSRSRIEKSRNLLLNPNLRISEIAFEVGFQSLTHFNRVFRKALGQSPTDYRAQLQRN
jgi:AraC-like DNA-binding protein/ligand-binding sensor protein